MPVRLSEIALLVSGHAAGYLYRGHDGYFPCFANSLFINSLNTKINALYTGSLLHLTNIVCLFPPLFRRACGLRYYDEWVDRK